MSKLMILASSIGICCTIFGLVGFIISLARENRWGLVLAGLGSLALILFLTLLSIEYADDFWKGRS